MRDVRAPLQLPLVREGRPSRPADERCRAAHARRTHHRRLSQRREALPMKNRLRVLRAESQWSQADLASKLGVSRQTVNSIETGKYDPSLPLAFQIAGLFKLRIED